MKALVKRGSTMALTAMAALWVFAGTALADPDPAQEVIDEVTDGFGDMETIVLGLISALFALLVIGVGVRVGSKYLRRGGSAG